MPDRITPAIPAATLGIFLVIGTFIVSHAMYSVKALENTIAVTGSAQQIITSDTVKWNVSLSRSVDLGSLPAGNAQISSDLAAFKNYLKKGGVDDTAITVSPVTVTTQYDYNKGQSPTGYQLTQNVLVEAADVQKVTTLAQKASNLLNQGALVSTTSLEYYYSKLADLKVDLLAAATKDAQNRAQKVAESAGSSLGPLRSASMGVLQITAVHSTDISDSGTYDTSTIQKQVTGVVRASFSVQ